MHWIKLILKRGKHNQKTKGYMAKQVQGEKNVFMAEIPDNEVYK